VVGFINKKNLCTGQKLIKLKLATKKKPYCLSFFAAIYGFVLYLEKSE